MTDDTIRVGTIGAGTVGKAMKAILLVASSSSVMPIVTRAIELVSLEEVKK